MTAEPAATREDVEHGLLELAAEDVFGLCEIREQWPRELCASVLVDLADRGLLVVGRACDLDVGARAAPAAPVNSVELGAVLSGSNAWEPSIADWRNRTYLAFLATATREAD